jgi:hypothetical protein
MILLVMFLGAFFVYALIAMAFIVAMVGVFLSLCVYALSYFVMLCWASFRHRKSPEWKFEKKLWKPDLEEVQTYSMMAGITSMVWMVVGFFAYAFTRDWGSTIGWVIGFSVLCGIIMYGDREELKNSIQDQDREKPGS